MIKFAAQTDNGNLFGFGLTESNLNRLQFNQEPIFFDFGYMGHPELFALIVYLEQCATPEAIAARMEAVYQACIPFLSPEHGVTVETLRVFPIAKSVMQKLRDTPYWGYDTQTEIWQPGDKQLFFSGRSEQDIQEYLQKSGLISPKTKQTSKGFGKWN